VRLALALAGALVAAPALSAEPEVRVREGTAYTIYRDADCLVEIGRDRIPGSCTFARSGKTLLQTFHFSARDGNDVGIWVQPFPGNPKIGRATIMSYPDETEAPLAGVRLDANGDCWIGIGLGRVEGQPIKICAWKN
jgi:hypothetical protein